MGSSSDSIVTVHGIHRCHHFLAHRQPLLQCHQHSPSAALPMLHTLCCVPCRALAERVEWACREVLGGKEALAIVLSSLVSAAVAGKQLPAAEQQVFKQVALSVLDSVLKDNKAQLANTCASQQGCSEVLLSLGLAMQQLKV